ncbi:hypothetical protein E2C01_063909 [Portunus trituberculatus]|uniref:Uncharacterized protein n=1 Tax=Portunus trituberculatus TaxID=210409 RepID=A0A5B7HIX8_PORTR|nr:hypothetical protein [Portunus trituberculatus]
MNNDMKKTLDKIKMEKSTIKGNGANYEVALQGLEQKLNTSMDTGKGISEIKLEEWKKVWKKEQDEEKVNSAEVVKQQIRAKKTVIQVIREKEELVR